MNLFHSRSNMLILWLDRKIEVLACLPSVGCYLRFLLFKIIPVFRITRTPRAGQQSPEALGHGAAISRRIASGGS